MHTVSTFKTVQNGYHSKVVNRPVLCIRLLSLERILGPHSLWVNKFTLPRQNVSAQQYKKHTNICWKTPHMQITETKCQICNFQKGHTKNSMGCKQKSKLQHLLMMDESNDMSYYLMFYHITKAYSFPRAIEFWAKPRNLPFSAIFHGILQKLKNDWLFVQ